MSDRISMKTLLAPVILLSVSLALATDAPGGEDAGDRLEQSRAIIAEFASRLQHALRSAMIEGGPAAATEVCRDEAPRIASELSRQFGVNVERTSLRYRNPANMPTPWQSAVLQQFEDDAEQGEPPDRLEYLDDAGARYMKAIPTGGLCLACHGSRLAPDVETALAESYPHDPARGYTVGDIRGAFSVTWPTGGQTSRKLRLP